MEGGGRRTEGGGEAKKHKKPQKSYRRDVENGGDLGGKRKQRNVVVCTARRTSFRGWSVRLLGLLLHTNPMETQGSGV